jgi:hypothetical protein
MAMAYEFKELETAISEAIEATNAEARKGALSRLETILGDLERRILRLEGLEQRLDALELRLSAIVQGSGETFSEGQTKQVGFGMEGRPEIVEGRAARDWLLES